MEKRDNPERRPSPEALLREAQQAEHGRLKIFFGAAPGVGKTYEMLTAARAKKAEGVDVAIGVVETHGRKETEALLQGLEIIPRRVPASRSRGGMRTVLLSYGCSMKAKVFPRPLSSGSSTSSIGFVVPTGSVIGLAICRGFVEAMGGSITAANRVDQSGAVFTITLPVPVTPGFSSEGLP